MAETLHFSTYGEDKSSSTPLVLLHGWGLNSGVWQLFIEQLPKEFWAKFYIVTVDLPGFGKNHQIELQPYSITNIVDKLNEALPQPAIYLGWSLGGLIASEMALAYPNNVLALITVASSPNFVEEINDAQAKTITWPGIKPVVLNAFHQQLAKDTQKTISNFLKIQAMGSPHIRQDIKQITELIMQYPMPTKITLDQSLTLLETSDYRQKLASINQPFLRLYGSSDGLVPKAVVGQVNDLAKQSDFYILEQASHAPFISHPDDFKRVVSQWLHQHFV